VAYTAPGDQITARVSGREGLLVDVIEPGPSRDKPVCGLYSDCGGCALQHLTPEFQRDWKGQRVRDALISEGVAVPDITPSPVFPANSRRRATLSVARISDGSVIGFKARKTHTIVPMTECHILLPELFEAITSLPPLLALFPTSWRTFSIRLTACDNGFDLDILGDNRVNSATVLAVEDFDVGAMERLGSMMAARSICRFSVAGNPVMFSEPPVVQFDGLAVNLPPGGFLQASRQGQSALLDTVKDALNVFGVKPGAMIADLFSGCGAFALPLARRYKVFAADSDAAGIDALNTAANSTSGLKPLEAQTRDLYQAPMMADELNRFEIVILDPPRAGAPAQVKALNASTVERIISVSCNPQSFARDARILGKGGFRLMRLTLVDQFIFSPHVELVGVFDRPGASER